MYNPPEIKAHEYIIIEFHCLLSAMQWGFDDSSAVFMRFSASQLGSFMNCYGPMKKISRSVIFIYKSDVFKYIYFVLTTIK